jgi:putative pre-16S rRNA nuclease
MNLLSIDFGTKRIGLAISIQGIITPISAVDNNPKTINQIQGVIDQYQIEKIYIGLSEGKIAELTKKFINQLQSMIKLPIETVEEAVSTIEADQIFSANKKKKKNYKKLIDSISAAVILRRVNN